MKTRHTWEKTEGPKEARVKTGDEPTLGQGPYVAFVIQDEVQSFRRVHDGSDAGHAGKLQQGVGDASATATGQSLQCLHQQVQTPQLQELHHPGLIAGLQPPPQTRVVHHRGNLKGTWRGQR